MEERPFVIRMDDPSRRMAVFYCGELGYRSWSSIVANAVRYKTREAAEADIRRFSLAIEPESQITVTKA